MHSVYKKCTFDLMYCFTRTWQKTSGRGGRRRSSKRKAGCPACLNSGRCAHRPRYNLRPYRASAKRLNNQCSIGATAPGSARNPARRVYVKPVQQRAVDVLWGPQWALTECVQWGERRQWSHLRFSGSVSFLRSICRTRLEVVAATGR